MRKQSYSISELAKEFDVTTRTIRFYEEKGLLSPHREGTSRVYSPTDRTRLRLIVRGKRLGFTLDESREIIDMYNPDAGNREQVETLMRGIRSKREALQSQLNELQTMMKDLDESERKCIESLSSNKHIQ